MYKLFKNPFGDNPVSVWRLSDMAIIPFDPSNTDYQKFKLDIESGSELQDSDGKKMTKSKVTAFLKTLP